MAKKRARKGAAASQGDSGSGKQAKQAKRPLGVAAVGFMKHQGTRTHRKAGSGPE